LEILLTNNEKSAIIGLWGLRGEYKFKYFSFLNLENFWIADNRNGKYVIQEQFKSTIWSIRQQMDLY
jgi:hypothetical protein